MARNLTSVPDIEPVSGDYPSGRIQNEDPPVVGTPIIEELYGDLVQFFHKIMRLAGLAYNGLPDNETNSFQFITALGTWIRSLTGSLSTQGVWQSASIAETQAGLLATKVVTPVGLQGKSATTGETRDGLSTTRMVTPYGLAAKDGGLITKFINIGVWNMDSTALKSVAHGLTFAKIRSAKAFVYDDTSSYCKDVLSGDNANNPGSVSWDSTNINLYRGSLFDTTDFNDAVMNRGFIIIQSIP